MCTQSLVEGRDMSLHLESEEDCACVILPLNVDPCVRAAAEAHAGSHLVTPNAGRIPGTLYMLEALSDLMKHRVPLRVLAGCLHLATCVLAELNPQPWQISEPYLCSMQ